MSFAAPTLSEGAVGGARGAEFVFRSLTVNSRRIFRVLAEYQLAHPAKPGLTFAKLLSRCQDKFLSVSDLTLRAQLQDFHDHQLIKTCSRANGVECHFIALPADAVRQLLALQV
eukprot:gnl/Spiro4/3382_TR1642_c0_g2_i1.p3 gnl/Spiro4/3382_TR1642_c0_g2~~gnl/Spiro4/3382_TR1642_c0_g2_i1.p3  ORF type:complete len:114 (-),score=34.93 gnl/Spiro4/3382_TR1642_c0_g2_i1:115-456(-)